MKALPQCSCPCMYDGDDSTDKVNMHQLTVLLVYFFTNVPRSKVKCVSVWSVQNLTVVFYFNTIFT